MSQILTLLRHALAVVAALFVTRLADLVGIEATEDAIQGATDVLTWLGVGIFALAYAWGEKLLKPLSSRMGEVQPGQTRELANTERRARDRGEL